MRAPAVSAFLSISSISILSVFTLACGRVDVDESDDQGDDDGSATEPDAAGGMEEPDAGEDGADAGEEPAVDLVDDFEDGDRFIIESGGRVGFWYVINDGTKGGVQEPFPEFIAAEGGAGPSKYSAHTSGSGFTDWGAKLGVDLNREDPAGERQIYDAGRYTGIQFQYRSDVRFRAVIVTAGVLDEAHGGTCVQDGKTLCDDYHGGAVDSSADWQKHRIPFAEMEQVGWGRELPLDMATAMAIEFEFADVLAFDVEVDDVALY